MNPTRLRIEVSGAVQGVGFRPFVYRLARDEGLAGWVRNSPAGASLEVEGEGSRARAFLTRLQTELPPPGEVLGLTVVAVEPRGEVGFTIRQSSDSASLSSALILPDLAPCSACLRELADPTDRRFGYPFLNCTACGPRFSIIEKLPYDRPHTSMRRFPLCRLCRTEYEDPANRRFHAQPIACPACGPQLKGDLEEACRVVREGGIVALKAVGGFQLWAHPGRSETLRRLRGLKARPHKPLALMVEDRAQLESLCRPTSQEWALLSGPERPIVLLERRPDPTWPIAPEVAPGCSRLGLMLPSSPLHQLMMERLGEPAVVTSGNRGGEPLALTASEVEALADFLLDHDRPVVRPLDDSLVTHAAGSARVLRRARGLAPTSLQLPFRLSCPVLAVGGHQKVTVTLGFGSSAVTSQHLGDMDRLANRELFEQTIQDLLSLHGVSPGLVAHDAHPDYFTTIWAEQSGLPLRAVQHHHAHLAAALCEHGIGPREEVLGIVWDGTGYGNDGTIWGGEFLRGGLAGFQRAAHLRAFPLAGGERASRDPELCAKALLSELGHGGKSASLRPSRGTTSAGRLFDGVAWLLGFRDRCSYEGQAAAYLEELAQEGHRDAYPMPLRRGVLDWGEAVQGVLEDRSDPPRAAARFHNALVAGATEMALAVDLPRVVLSGGCFQNRRLLESLSRSLSTRGYEVLIPSRYPCNDGGLSLGQLAVACSEELNRSAEAALH